MTPATTGPAIHAKLLRGSLTPPGGTVALAVADSTGGRDVVLNRILWVGYDSGMNLVGMPVISHFHNKMAPAY